MGALLAVARQIRAPGEYVGYAAFLLFAMCKKVVVHAWEGANRVNLLNVYARWALRLCERELEVDAVCCACVPDDAGQARLVAITEAHGMQACRHYIAGAQTGAEVNLYGDDIESFYGKLGITLLGTVTDGDCAFDVMLAMLCETQTADARLTLRNDRVAIASLIFIAADIARDA